MPMKESSKLDARYNLGIGTLRRSLFSFTPLHKVPDSDRRSFGDGTNLSPRFSGFSNSNTVLKRSSCDHHSPKVMEDPWRHSLTDNSFSHRTPVLKPATELVKEIAALEIEVLHLEQHLLSLYRTAFERHLATTTVDSQASEAPLICETCSPVKSIKYQGKLQSKTMSWNERSVPISSLNRRKNKSCGPEEIEKIQDYCDTQRHDLDGLQHRSVLSAKISPIDSPKPTSHHRSLADFLDFSIIDCASETPCKLSEEIIRCISSIYSKLADPPTPHTEFSESPTSSLSSSSTFSPPGTSDAWSPKYLNDTNSPCHSDSLKKKVPCRGTLEVFKICIDGERFKYAATTLQHFKDLIGRLETIDPKKMKHNERLAFWINIHNALVMHAFLAYGLRQNYMKTTSSITKAAYNVGGLSLNVYEIQRSILQCHFHRPELKLQSLFSHSQKFTKVNGKHAYALDNREPLVHFALCMGAYSEPMVRIYTPKNVFKELEIAKDEFVRANVSINGAADISLPKILQYYAKDASMELPAILEMVQSCMPEIQQKPIEKVLKGKPEKHVEWVPYKSNFRYIIHRDLAKD